MPKKLDLSGYKRWLVRQGYQPSTVQVSMRHLRALAAWDISKTVPQYRLPHIRRYLRYVDDTKDNPMGPKFIQGMKSLGLTAVMNISKQGPRGKTLLGGYEWTTLRSRLRRGDEASKLLVAYMLSPYRIGEFLNLRAHKVTEEDIADKISRDWIKTRGGRQRLFRLVCETERCTYYRMRRRLQDMCDKLEIEADFDSLYKTYQTLRKAS
jgi:hypothetical protein